MIQANSILWYKESFCDTEVFDVCKVLCGGKGRFYILCHKSCDKKQIINYSSTLFCEWASEGLGLTETTMAHEGL